MKFVSNAMKVAEPVVELTTERKATKAHVKHPELKPIDRVDDEYYSQDDWGQDNNDL